MKKDSFLSKQRHTTPSRLTVCILLAGGDHKAGAFLYSIQHWAKYASASIPGVEGSWIANTRVWWMRECCLTSSQYDRTIAKLAKMGRIERRQWWFGPKNVLYLRPTTKALEYITSATTWEAASQFLPSLANGSSGMVESENLGSLELAISKEAPLSDEPGSPISPISNIISNSSNNNLKFTPEYAAPASPPCVNGKMVDAKKKKTPGMITKQNSDQFAVDFHRVWKNWNSVLMSRYPEQVQAGEGPCHKELGGLASVENAFAQFVATDATFEFANDPEAYGHCFYSFLISVIDQWPTMQCWQKPTYPKFTFLTEHWGDFIQGWLAPDCCNG